MRPIIFCFLVMASYSAFALDVRELEEIKVECGAHGLKTDYEILARLFECGKPASLADIPTLHESIITGEKTLFALPQQTKSKSHTSLSKGFEDIQDTGLNTQAMRISLPNSKGEAVDIIHVENIDKVSAYCSSDDYLNELRRDSKFIKDVFTKLKVEEGSLTQTAYGKQRIEYRQIKNKIIVAKFGEANCNKPQTAAYQFFWKKY